MILGDFVLLGSLFLVLLLAVIVLVVPLMKESIKNFNKCQILKV